MWFPLRFLCASTWLSLLGGDQCEQARPMKDTLPLPQQLNVEKPSSRGGSVLFSNLPSHLSSPPLLPFLCLLFLLFSLSVGGEQECREILFLLSLCLSSRYNDSNLDNCPSLLGFSYRFHPSRQSSGQLCSEYHKLVPMLFWLSLCWLLSLSFSGWAARLTSSTFWGCISPTHFLPVF